jgi:uncharacterized protein
MRIRDAIAEDLEEILLLNQEFEHYLSPLTLPRIRELLTESAYHRVAIRDDRIAAFLLAFREDAEYDSANYVWFAERYKKFLYIDRVAVSGRYQGQGVGFQLYSDLFEFARQARFTRVTCEYNLDPPNEGSALFHRRFGFVEVGRQRVGEGAKLVSLQEMRL